MKILSKGNIFPSVVVKRQTPKNIQLEDVLLFKHEYEKILPPVYYYELNDICITQEGVVFKNVSAFTPCFINPARKKYYSWRYFISTIWKKKMVVLPEEKYLLAFDEWSNGYFHWICDVLPRLISLKNQGVDISEYYLLLPEGYIANYIFETLKIIDLKGVQRIPHNSYVYAKTLLMPEHLAPTGNYNVQIMQQLRSELLSLLPSNSNNFGDKIYINRKKAAHRFILNEDEVLDILQKVGFKSLSLEDFSMSEKIAICKNAKYIISTHGAGLTNMLFMQSGTSVMEIRPIGDSSNNAYYSLADSLKINYYYLLSDFENTNTHDNKYDFKVDIVQLKNTVNLMLRPH